MKFHQLLQQFVRADLNSYAANDWEHPPGDNWLCRSDQVTVRSCRRILSQCHVWPIPHLIPPMFALELTPPRYHGGAFRLDVPDTVVPTQMLCNREAMARSTRWYLCNEYTILFLPRLWRAISMISNLHIHDMIRPVQLAAGYDSSQPHSFLSPDAVEGNVNDIILQYTRGDTPCRTCSRLRFISNLTPCSLETLWRAILMISYRNIHEVIPCTIYSRWRFISNLTHFSLQTLWRAILTLSYSNIHEVIRLVQPAAG